MADNIAVRDATGTPVTMRSADQGGIQVPIHRLDSLPLVGATGITAANQDLLTNTANGWYDASAFFSGSVMVIGSGTISSGAIIFEQTNDNSSTTGIPLEVHELGVINQNPLIAAITMATSVRRAFAFNLSCRYIRVRISTVIGGGGSLQAIALFSQQPFANPNLNVQQATTGNLLSTVTPTSGTSHTATAAASTNATSVKGSAGNLFALTLTNYSAGTKYFKIYAKATAPSVGTDTPIMTIPVPATSSLTLEFGPVGHRIGTGIAYAITGAMADADTTALAAGDVKVVMTYN